MDYTVKQDANGVTVPLSVCMPRTRADDRISATESKFYHPAAADPSFAASRLKRLWAALFSHGVETPR